MPLAVLGAGAVGRMHIQRCMQHEDVCLSAIADPSPEARALAASLGVPWFPDVHALLAGHKPAAVIAATPNATHGDVGIACVDQGLPVLVEKPVADTVLAAERLCAHAEQRGVPLLVGHQRRHNPILRKARELVLGGALGRPVSVTGMSTWLKPDSYFEPAWRRQAGGGPVMINLIHDVDLLRHLLGEVVQVQAITSNAVRGFEVEDTAAVALQFACGALGTLSVSDAAVAPWNWDLAAGEAAHYAQVTADSHHLCGTEGALTLPRLNLWRYRGARGWQEPLSLERTPVHRADPYAEQLRHFRAVAEGQEAPLCSGRDGLRTLQVTCAVHEAARTRQPVSLEPLNPDPERRPCLA